MLEDEAFAGHEVQHGTGQDGGAVRRDRIEAEPAREQRGDEDVARQRDRPVQRMEPEQPYRDLAGGSRRAVAPRPALVQQEVVHDGAFDRCRRGPEIGHVQAPDEDGYRGELHEYSQRADTVESKPPPRQRPHTW